MMQKPRFRKGKKTIGTTRRTPKQERLYRRYLHAVVTYRIKVHAARQTAVRLALSAAAAAINSMRIAQVQQTAGITPQEKALAIAQICIGIPDAMAKAWGFSIPEPDLTV
jgi:hypothetical protein